MTGRTSIATDLGDKRIELFAVDFPLASKHLLTGGAVIAFSAPGRPADLNSEGVPDLEIAGFAEVPGRRAREPSNSPPAQ
jgi:hypothetical protein